MDTTSSDFDAKLGKILTVPNWSFGRDTGLLRTFRDELESMEVDIHFLKGDVDHNRTVSAFSGSPSVVREALMRLSRIALPGIDLNRHMGCHPRIGALDVCPFIPWTEPDPEFMNSWVDSISQEFADEFEIPVFLYEKSEKGRHSKELPALRKAGFGGLLDQELSPDFGPTRTHKYNGVTVMGWRSFLIALNVNLMEDSPTVAQNLAQKIRIRRQDGDLLFKGVRSLGFALTSRRRSQVSMNLTKPDETYCDQIIEWVFNSARRAGAMPEEPELIGVIRVKDMEHATHIRPMKSQILEMR